MLLICPFNPLPMSNFIAYFSSNFLFLLLWCPFLYLPGSCIWYGYSILWILLFFKQYMIYFKNNMGNFGLRPWPYQSYCFQWPWMPYSKQTIYMPPGPSRTCIQTHVRSYLLFSLTFGYYHHELSMSQFLVIIWVFLHRLRLMDPSKITFLHHITSSNYYISMLISIMFSSYISLSMVYSIILVPPPSPSFLSHLPSYSSYMASLISDFPWTLPSGQQHSLPSSLLPIS